MTSPTQIPEQDTLEVQPKDILHLPPHEIVDIALESLQRRGIELIEWRALLHCRMNVPLVVRNFAYLVPDDNLETASHVLTDLGLPYSPPTKFRLATEGDFELKGRSHRITRSTSQAYFQHIILYPMSFSCLDHSELTSEPPFHMHPSPRCANVLVPRQSAVYASLIRMMLEHPLYGATRTILSSDLSELVGYNLLDIQQGYVDSNDTKLWKELEVDRRTTEAVWLIKRWGWDGEWREGEDWIGDALAAIIDGSGDISHLPAKPTNVISG